MNIDAWLNQTVTVQPMTGRTGSGDPQYGDKRTVKARIERNVRLRIGVDNALQDVHVMVTKEPVTVGSRVWFPDDNSASNTAARRPLGVRTAPNKQGTFQFYEAVFSA